MGRLSLGALSLLVVTFAVAGCSSEGQDRTCETQDDCEAGELCLDGICQEPATTDGDSDVDADSDSDIDADADTDADADHDIPDPIDFPDTDGDGISDLHEGLGAADTDGDGTPDTEDLDSDGDGLADSDEAGDDDDTTPPTDTDGDGVPDFRDLDSDGDGIPDVTEGMSDPDGDGTPSFLDFDSDGDGIGDAFEGEVDPDGDGTPSYLDDDSDGDGVTDELEGGDGDPSHLPPDSDGDGILDFLDLDSDDDLIPDEIEGGADPDGDGIGSFRDPDSDGDGVPDWLEAGDEDLLSPPVDTDGDATEDYLDGDSDGDLIADRHEFVFDTDGDGVHDISDLDSDDDGLMDQAEAGDDDPDTPPVDTDGDGLPDYRDTDSDNDGLSDHREATEEGTDPYDDDSDDDGVTDLIEVAAGTDPTSDADNPRARGDFVFLEPYMAPPDPTEDTLSFSTEIRVADVYFLMDTTGSMGGEITNLRTSLSGTVIPGIEAAISDVWFGVGAFDDYPYSPYGSASSGDLAYYNRQYMTNSTSAAQTAVNSLTTHYGADGPESDIPALHAIATGCGDGGGTYGVPNDPSGACTDPALIGYPHFRSGAVPIIVLMTDWAFHNGTDAAWNYGAIPGVTAPSWAATVAALNSIAARVIGVNSGTTARADLEAIAVATGTVDAGGVPFVYDIPSTGSGLGAQVIAAVEAVSGGVPMDITAVPIDDPSDGVDAVVAFVDHIEPNTTAGAPCTPGLTTTDHDGDGARDTFVDVVPGTMVCFDVIPRENHTVPPTADPQTFMATIQVWGDHVTILDERDVYFLVPPEVPGGQ